MKDYNLHFYGELAKINYHQIMQCHRVFGLWLQNNELLFIFVGQIKVYDRKSDPRPSFSNYCLLDKIESQCLLSLLVHNKSKN